MELSTPNPKWFSQMVAAEDNIPHQYQMMNMLDNNAHQYQVISFGSNGSASGPMKKPNKAEYSRRNMMSNNMDVSQSYNVSDDKPCRAAQDNHVVSERKRREKLNQRLIALSAVIPSLKKMNKATVLEDTVEYIKQLEQRVKILETEAARKSMESGIIVKKSLVLVDDDASSSYDIDSNSQRFDHKLLEIEARVSEKHVLIRVHCESCRDCIPKILDLIDKMNLSIMSNNIIQFGSSILDITIVAQIEAEFRMTTEELVKNLRRDLLHSV